MYNSYVEFRVAFDTCCDEKFEGLVKIFGTNRNFGKQSIFWRKIEILVKNQNFTQKSNFDYISIIFRLYFDYISIIFWLYFDYISIIFRLYFDYISKYLPKIEIFAKNRTFFQIETFVKNQFFFSKIEVLLTREIFTKNEKLYQPKNTETPCIKFTIWFIK